MLGELPHIDGCRVSKRLPPRLTVGRTNDRLAQPELVLGEAAEFACAIEKKLARLPAKEMI